MMRQSKFITINVAVAKMRKYYRLIYENMKIDSSRLSCLTELLVSIQDESFTSLATILLLLFIVENPFKSKYNEISVRTIQYYCIITILLFCINRKYY